MNISSSVASGSGTSSDGGGMTSPTLLGGGREEGTTVLTDVEARDWGGWERVEFLVGVLARERGYERQPQPVLQPRYGGSSEHKPPERRTGSERMSITNII